MRNLFFNRNKGSHDTDSNYNANSSLLGNFNNNSYNSNYNYNNHNHLPSEYRVLLYGALLEFALVSAASITHTVYTYHTTLSVYFVCDVMIVNIFGLYFAVDALLKDSLAQFSGFLFTSVLLTIRVVEQFFTSTQDITDSRFVLVTLVVVCLCECFYIILATPLMKRISSRRNQFYKYHQQNQQNQHHFPITTSPTPSNPNSNPHSDPYFNSNSSSSSFIRNRYQSSFETLITIDIMFVLLLAIVGIFFVAHVHTDYNNSNNSSKPSILALLLVVIPTPFLVAFNMLLLFLVRREERRLALGMAAVGLAFLVMSMPAFGIYVVVVMWVRYDSFFQFTQDSTSTAIKEAAVSICLLVTFAIIIRIILVSVGGLLLRNKYYLTLGTRRSGAKYATVEYLSSEDDTEESH